MSKTYYTTQPVPAPAPVQANPWQRGTLVVVEPECHFAADRSRARIVVESTNDDLPRSIEDLQSTDSRNLAVAYASAMGVGDARLNGNVEGPYAINDDGVSLDEVADQQGGPLPYDHPKMKVAAYRCVVPVTRKLL